MPERAKLRQPPDGRIEWSVANALSLPFDDASFDAVFCQFGAMFFPDKTKVHAEALRVLKPGAPFLFNVWNNLADNEIADVVREAVYERYLDNPADFFARVPLCRRGSALGRLRDGFRLWSSPQGFESGWASNQVGLKLKVLVLRRA